MVPKINKTSKYIEVIGHYDNSVLCAKLTLLANLYAIEHREGYAKFDIKDEDKLRLIDGKLEFPEEPEPHGQDIVPGLTDLTGTTWIINNVPALSPLSSEQYFAINYTTNQRNCEYIGINEEVPGPEAPFPHADFFLVYDNNDFPVYLDEWEDEAYRTIEITGGTDVTNSNLIAWLQANATQVQSGPTYSLSTTLNKCTIINLSFTLTPNSGYTLPDNISVTNATLVSYDSTSGEVVLSNINDNSSVDVEFNELPPYLTFSSPNTFTLNVKDNTKHWDGTIQYSTDTITWSTWGGTTTLSSTQSGTTKYLYLRGISNTVITGYDGQSDLKGWKLIGSNISCDGNIENLLDYQTVVNGNHPTMSAYCYTGIFKDCTNLIKAPQLSAITLAENCYKALFRGCTSLTTAPELPATTLANYCYCYMFLDCTSLTTAPALPATNLAPHCYYWMFSGCSSLTTPPELPATTLTEQCYIGMFSKCTSLTTAPVLSATTLAEACYSSMFQRCTSLTVAPVLSVTTLANNCYSSMFYGCTSLTTAPVLPATTLKNYCYNMMFYGCTNLVTPAIMAGGTTQVTAVQNCCRMMYYNCTSLNIYTSSSGHTPFYKSITYSTSSSSSNYQSSYQMFYNCKINGSTSTVDYLTAGTQYYY